MERTDRIATHDGVVVAVGDLSVTVRIQTVSACAACAAHAKCGFAETKDKTLDIHVADTSRFSIGDHVQVAVDSSRGLRAVWVAYLLPALLMLLSIAILALFHASEWLMVLSAFATLGLYIMFLYILRHKINSRFTLTLTPNS